ncbi:unnamed protein product [Sphenostylis stenocarpa]|uniref:Uncharacterized protein n=1 Tax=Sphenostylis stenocarpa TaxID=92480 RepID=A0AA86T158_9FABA|nr:unnamed protein product [Sphenostylis stenocarpa]
MTLPAFGTRACPGMTCAFWDPRASLARPAAFGNDCRVGPRLLAWSVPCPCTTCASGTTLPGSGTTCRVLGQWTCRVRVTACGIGTTCRVWHHLLGLASPAAIRHAPVGSSTPAAFPFPFSGHTLHVRCVVRELHLHTAVLGLH